METKHSPSPWSLQDWAAHDQHGAIEVCGSQVVDANGHMISAATVEGASEAEEANARLIAAAPDMLEALRELDECYCEAGPHLSLEDRQRHRVVLIKARAAVTKAIGSAT